MAEMAVADTTTKPHVSEESQKKKVRDTKCCGLKKCFSALVDRKQVNLELEVLRLMLRKELEIQLDSLAPNLADMMPYLLVYYIKNWPGWQKSVDYYSGNIPFKTWYEKFQKFITLKLNEAITVHYKEAMKELEKEKIAETRTMYMLKKIADKNTQTDNLAPKIQAPFTIEIMAKPVLLNTIVFTDTPEGDIILKQHVIPEWDKAVIDSITLKQLITWPHVGVHMMCPIFSFVRRNLHEFRRNVSLLGTPLSPTHHEFIEEMKILNPNVNRYAFTIDYLKDLAHDFIDALKNVYLTPAIIEAFQTVINEFLADVEEIDVKRNGKPTIANETAVLFNIGKVTYFRNKKLLKATSSRYDIGYTEVIIPKVEVALMTVGTEETTNAYLNHLKNFKNESSSSATGNINLPLITFSCSFCLKNFENGSQIANHLKDEHKMEQAMLCTHCKHSFSVLELTKNRWYHNCEAGNKSSKSSK